MVGMVADVALHFVSAENFDTQVDHALATIGSFLGVSRCYLFLDSSDGLTTRNTHEWCASGVVPQIENLQDVSYAVIPSWKAILMRGDIFSANDIEGLPEDIRVVLEPQGILSILIAPLSIDGMPRGFLGCDDCQARRVWGRREMDVLTTVMSIMATAYARKLLADKLSRSEDNFRQFFDTIDDIIVVGDLQGVLVYANGGACRKLGRSLDELLGVPILELHPKEKRDEARAILEEMFAQRRSTCPLELQARDGSCIPVETRIWFGEWDGKPCIFGISKDLSAEQASLQMFERLFRGNPTAMSLSRVKDKTLVDVNEALLRVFGYTREEILGAPSLWRQALGEEESWRKARDVLLREGVLRDCEIRMRGKYGRSVDVLFSSEIIQSQGEEYYLSVFVDITGQKQLQADLEDARARLAHIIEGTRLGTWEWNVRSGECVFNEEWAAMLGYTLDELQPTSVLTWNLLTHKKDLLDSERRLKDHFEGRSDYYECEVRMRHKNGSWIWVHDRGKVIERDSQGKPLKMYGTHSDITEKRLMQMRLQEMAVRDPLTEVYNRRHIFERLAELESEYRRGQTFFCVTILDIDFFKNVNDTYGHQAGDFVLKSFVRTIASSIRPYDLLGRYGGEEFIIVSPTTLGEVVQTMLDRLLERVRMQEYVFGDHTIQFTFSGGCAGSEEFAPDGFGAEALVAVADKRLYLAKNAGRNRCMGPWNN